MRTLKEHKFREAWREAVEREQARLEKEGNRKQLTGVEYFALRSQVRADIESYLLEHGEKDITKEMMAKWTGEATRHCLKNMIGTILDEPPSPQALQAARKRIQERMAGRPTLRQQEAKVKETEPIAALIPAAPSPAFIAKNGSSILDKLDFFVEMNKLYADANLMRKKAVRIDAKTGEEVVGNDRTFDRSISRRLEILATSIATQKELWDLQRMEAFYATIIETIAAAAPEVAQEIQKRLAQMNIHVGAV